MSPPQDSPKGLPVPPWALREPFFRGIPIREQVQELPLPMIEADSDPYRSVKVQDPPRDELAELRREIRFLKWFGALGWLLLILWIAVLQLLQGSP